MCSHGHYAPKGQRQMSRIYVPSSGPESWRAFLAEPEKHWKTGYSARALAHAWEDADGLPAEIAALFDEPAALQLAIPEHKVPLPGGSRESQSDLFALLTIGARSCAATIEGKVNEPFGPTVGEWLKDASDGKQKRLSYVSGLLGLSLPLPTGIRYQLLHRTASAIVEADRFKTHDAAMVVHSFSPERMWFEDFARFLALLGFTAAPDKRFQTELPSGRVLHLAWASGDAKYLAM